mmetsp:Transcript_4522/g.17111  ORF Transcript_4522/g.17111 Transcript_4522/m.17111 type:complete len:203 (-) Transcript_4522:1618-2226(-)
MLIQVKLRYWTKSVLPMCNREKRVVSPNKLVQLTFQQKQLRPKPQSLERAEKLTSRCLDCSLLTHPVTSRSPISVLVELHSVILPFSWWMFFTGWNAKLWSLSNCSGRENARSWLLSTRSIPFTDGNRNRMRHQGTPSRSRANTPSSFSTKRSLRPSPCSLSRDSTRASTTKTRISKNMSLWCPPRQLLEKVFQICSCSCAY